MFVGSVIVINAFRAMLHEDQIEEQIHRQFRNNLNTGPPGRRSYYAPNIFTGRYIPANPLILFDSHERVRRSYPIRITCGQTDYYVDRFPTLPTLHEREVR